MSLEFRVLREELTDVSTVGRLFMRNGPDDPWTWICYTLEDAVREVQGQPVAAWKARGRTTIPYGSYGLVVTMSVRFGKPLPLLVDVPGFAGVRIHGGNTAADTEGCILVAHSHPARDVIRGNATPEVLAILGTAGNRATITIERKEEA